MKVKYMNIASVSRINELAHQSELRENPFANPRDYRHMILNHIRIASKIKYDGKGFICALITSRCHVGCEHCMFASNMAEERNSFNTMTPERVNKLMQLVTDSNTAFLLVSGGGEGFLEFNLMQQIAEKSTANLTWLVTSGFWAKTLTGAQSILEKLHSAYIRGCARYPDRQLCVRVSIDTFHVNKLRNSEGNPFQYIQHLVTLFETKYASQKNFFLQLHSLEGQEELIDALGNVLGAEKLPSKSEIHTKEKVTESALTLRMPSGYSFEVTFAKRLLSDMAVDLRNKKLLIDRINIWEKDAFINEKDLAGTHLNSNGSIGADMLVIYDGRVSGGWQSEMPDVQINIDIDSYQDILTKSFNDPGVLATIEQGLSYRFRIINEVNPLASIRAKAVNIRDYTSPILLEEDTTKLYYTIRAIQDFIADGRLANLPEHWPRPLVDLLMTSREELKALYKLAQYDIIRQFEETEPGFTEFSMAFLNYVRHQNPKEFRTAAHKAANNDQRRLDKWRLLLKRIDNGWYTIFSWDNSQLAHVGAVESLLDQSLHSVRIYEGLSRFHPTEEKIHL